MTIVAEAQTKFHSLYIDRSYIHVAFARGVGRVGVNAVNVEVLEF